MRLLAILLICISLASNSCADKDNDVIKYLKNTPVKLLDFGLYCLSKKFEKTEVVSDDLVYELDGHTALGSNSEGKTVIRIDLDNIYASAVENKNKPKNESKAKLLCIDSINHVRMELGLINGKPLADHSFINSYFSLGEKRGRELDKSTEIMTMIFYEGKNNHIACIAPLLGTDIKFLETKDRKD